ncbi:MAG: ATP phosphoribosyltransferase regulatory subunit [Oscillatoriaceae bacterium SKW80]|nr:ATP phosphoribosyltransferase regulatory subunit [Oscillatoriaceae bacterium SKYG93]MCX8120144.1 ATP phosphoribosyltransferase regulatory subunit [Oscillatoriaceae bacterium SKW80]MDW8453070.1 ATP phosphoribosyltransferase regulatory subunit [Oscillatoriaceae cyanobacterium SKYGB_i_bin93]HIK29019.1 ATP phosphoribosyltransferase regulatory subunit [Oscillatoriaceae cyanobacterium M7585_C2015_266]
MGTTKVERVRGVNDILPDICAVYQQIEEEWKNCFESFGYRPIEVPLIEHTELYLKKSGEDIVDKLYDFTYRNRRLSLRPELTASVARAYVDNLQSFPLPIRLYYIGAAFRYERPQKGRYRQFTQMGIELIGAPDAMADTEVIAIACRGLERVGLNNYRLIISHIGVLTKFLDYLHLENRLSSFLLANLENLRKKGKEEIKNRLQEIYSIGKTKNESVKKITDLFKNMNDEEAKTAILDLLESMNIQIDGYRDRDEIVTRLLTKMKRQEQTAYIEKALEFMSQLGELKGEPTRVLKEAENLLSTYGIDCSILQHLRQIFNLLESYNIDQKSIIIDLGMSRGLQYYTGMIFEIYHSPEEERQICGGGRYDDLIAILGGQKTPATGFSCGLERLTLALELEGKLPVVCQSVDVLVVPVSVEDRSYAIGVAEKLRAEGLRVEIDVRSKSLSSNLQYAKKQEIPFTVIVGADERRTSEVTLKNMQSEEQVRVAAQVVGNQIRQMRKCNV